MQADIKTGTIRLNTLVSMVSTVCGGSDEPQIWARNPIDTHIAQKTTNPCPLYTPDAADELTRSDQVGDDVFII